MSDSRGKALIKDTAWFAIGSFGSKILSFLLVPLYTIALSPSEYGKIDILNTSVSLLSPILTLSICDAVFRYSIDEQENKKEILSSSLLLLLFSSVISLFLHPIFCKLLNSVAEYWWYFWVIFVLSTLSVVLSFFLKGIDKTKVFAIQGIIYTFVFSILNLILLLYLKIGLIGYLISQITGLTIVCLYMIFVGKIYKFISVKYIRKDTIKKMVAYSWPLIPASVAWFLMASIDRYMLLYMCTESDVGLYSIASKIPSILTTFTSFFISAWQISAVKIKNDLDSKEFIAKIYDLLISVSVFLSFVLILLSEYIASILFANEFYYGWIMIPSLVISAVFSTCSLFLGAQFTAFKRSDLHLYSNVIAMLANFIFSYVLISNFGAKGAAYGTMLSFYIVLIYRHYKVKKLTDFTYKKAKFYTSTISLIISGVLPSLNVMYWQVLVLLLFLVNIYLWSDKYKELYIFITKKIKSKIQFI